MSSNSNEFDSHRLTFPDSIKLSLPLRKEPTKTHTVAFRPYGDFVNAEKVIIAVHGLTGDSLNYHYLADYFLKKASNYAIISIDVMGRGDSQDSKSPEGPIDPMNYTYLQFIDDIVAILLYVQAQREAVKNQNGKYYYIGTSMGALLGMILTSRYDELLKHNIKFNAVMFNDIGPLVTWDLIEANAKHVLVDTTFPTRRAAVDHFNKNYSVHFGPKADELFYIHRSLYALEHNGEDGYKVVYDRKGIGQGALSRDAGELYNHPTMGKCYSVQSYFDQLELPLMVYRGNTSVLFPQIFLDEMEENYKQRGLEFESITWDATGHVPPLYVEEELEPLYQWFEKF